MSSETIQGKDVAKDGGEWSVGCVSAQDFGFWYSDLVDCLLLCPTPGFSF